MVGGGGTLFLHQTCIFYLTELPENLNSATEHSDKDTRKQD